ncbi:NAD(P)/FAD-dependent oxidoreductase [Emticicia sp. TH156]|uniref:phytoene desaturase family protein n=1 Tax=Emticicia sp. TH156 TaxID=2067454 RepID=UPI000C766D82|nr:NAD(P)/FAD-dependent oxidoreductase [Emticicia sp. TH156]PLK43101.1 FAD-dependent oxidoreductase [Emticicia sp. TH156]
MIYDSVIIGGGHNGLVAACYLAKAGKKVLVLEKNDYIGGGTTSQRVFPDYEAYLSRYSYLVSLFPEEIFDELNIYVKLFRRAVASYTPYVQDGVHKGLLISNVDEEVSRKSVLDLGYGQAEWEGYKAILQKQQTFAGLIWDSFLQPLKSKEEWKTFFECKGHAELWKCFVEEPIGQLIETNVQSDILRGVLMTDAKIGSYTHAHDHSLLQNRTFIYHVVGNKTGEWRVPQGGMGNLVAQLINKAQELGVELKTGASVERIKTGEVAEITFSRQTSQQMVKAKDVLVNAAPRVLEKLLGNSAQPPVSIEEGTAFKINLLLKKLPQLKDKSITPEQAFAGTFHINQSFTQMQETFRQAASGKIPDTIACEIYCHTLTDPSILSDDLQAQGYHTMTVFGLDLPYELFIKDNEAAKAEVVDKFLKGINEYLAEPIEDCLAQDKNGNWCIEAKSAVDIEKELGMPRGNIFHNGLSWFYAESDDAVGKWGVETPCNQILLCGSGAARGGAVSGIPGRNAAKLLINE